MRPAKTSTAVALALLLALAAGCARAEGNANAPAGAAQPNAPAPQPATPAQQARAQVFKGSIGDNLLVEMRLRREGDALSGSYVYVKNRADIALRGTTDAQGNVTLQEFDPAGKQTGLFVGRWGVGETGAAELKGTWTSPDGARALPFSLTELPVEFSAGLDLVTKEIKEENARLRYELSVEYPQIEGGGGPPGVAEFNRRAQGMAGAQVAEFKKYAGEEPAVGVETGSHLGTGYEVGVAADDVVSVLFLSDTYFSGAAHGNQTSEVLNFDLRQGRVLRLADLFKPSALYLRAISDFCVRDLKRQMRASDMSEPAAMDPQIEEGAGPNAKNFRSWLITRRGIEFHFDPYHVGPYAAGAWRVVVPYAELKDLINPEGPAGRFVR